ncbi:MAG TPA: polysaccharide biosynthesis/export family protein [Ideonella sp.]|uniref:polysaccharide biosynthesis/export family protein n=1 Tax=Ideonella sp. TaxID=1929293 RepID=UPI002D109811|nr:polysaccharide biosynthesis/export family protein [Ideonella sp.]HSI46723.1 polysaccharide biosynthesis/export family protein [Ideonella sp.]
MTKSFVIASLTALCVIVASPLVQAQQSITLPPGVTLNTAALQSPATQGLTMQAPSVTPAAASTPLPSLPSDGGVGKSVVFGSQIFSGRFAQSSSGFNPDYQITVGDRVSIRMWGAVTQEGVQAVDAQGNIFLQNAGPIRVLGVRNEDLNRQVDELVKKTFKANVGVYATLEAAQPVKIYVTGFVRAPGLYGGLSSDTVLTYLDLAGGIDPDRGSYLSVQVLRGGKPRATIDLYRFLLDGKIDRIQLQDGDTIVVRPRQYAVAVQGEAQNAYVFELPRQSVPASELIALAQPKADATHISIVRNTGVELKSEYYPLGSTANVQIQSGDLVTFTADKYATTLLVRIDGAQLGERALVMPNGAKLKDVIARLSPSPQADLSSLQLFRKSVAVRQKRSLDISLHNLETAALTARSSTSEEAALRQVEATLMLQFITRAQQIQPLGQVVLSDREQADQLPLEDGDLVVVPERSNMVLLSGEVLFPNALVYQPNAAVDDYIALAGGYTQSADTSKQILLHRNGSVAPPGTTPKPGDEIMILPKIESKSIEVARGITQILYQIAIAAKVAIGF